MKINLINVMSISLYGRATGKAEVLGVGPPYGLTLHKGVALSKGSIDNKRYVHSLLGKKFFIYLEGERVVDFVSIHKLKGVTMLSNYTSEINRAFRRYEEDATLIDVDLALNISESSADIEIESFVPVKIEEDVSTKSLV